MRWKQTLKTLSIHHNAMWFCDLKIIFFHCYDLLHNETIKIETILLVIWLLEGHIKSHKVHNKWYPIFASFFPSPVNLERLSVNGEKSARIFDHQLYVQKWKYVFFIIPTENWELVKFKTPFGDSIIPVVIKNPCKIWITPSKPPKPTNMKCKKSSSCTSEDVFSWVWCGFGDNIDFKAHIWHLLDWHNCQKPVCLRENVLYPTYISVALVFLGGSLSAKNHPMKS